MNVWPSVYYSNTDADHCSKLTNLSGRAELQNEAKVPSALLVISTVTILILLCFFNKVKGSI